MTTDKVEKHTDDVAFTNELTSNTDGNVTYESPNTAVATVNAKGEVTILKAGETAITARLLQEINMQLQPSPTS